VPVDICLFCEDSAHESCARALIDRAAAEVGIEVSTRIGAARFGIPRLRQELRAFQAIVARSGGTPDILVVMIDANAVGPNARRHEIEALIDNAVIPRAVIGTPDPCVERWLLADPVSFASLFDQHPGLPGTSSRVNWKTLLVEALEAGGEVVTQGGAEFSDEIVQEMDIYRARRADPTIQAFYEDLRAALRQTGADT
jgi:hypothetical protein